jgi:hypothetical protein
MSYLLPQFPEVSSWSKSVLTALVFLGALLHRVRPRSRWRRMLATRRAF